MLRSPMLPLLLALLLHTFAAAQHPLLPTAGGPAAKRPAKRIEGLLAVVARQFFCDPGFGICDNGCCQDGDSCCSKTGDCCPFAPHTAECCSFGGCCHPGEYCAEDSAGNVGCCPNGEVCSGGGGVGGGGGGGGGGGSGKTTTHKTTHTTPPPTTTPKQTTHEVTPPPTTTHKTTTHSDEDSDTSTTTSTHTPTPSGSTTPPSAGPGTQNVWTSVDSTEISWVGEWVSAKRCSGESSLDAIGSMTYTFTGYSIAMSFSSSNLAYSVSINGKSWSFAGTGTSDAAASNCTYSVVSAVAAGTAQVISVEVSISDTAASSGRRELKERTDGPWHLDVNDFVIQVADTSATDTGSPETPIPSGPASTVNSAQRLRFTPPLTSIFTRIAIVSVFTFSLL
ncbi:hypothetical protein B0H14DRAFT_2923089 [Mycena olivaceomarginata]|nr:hypothetical protein B0H14DRAFT_2923089 [Mycena olivaceomarginata]